VPAELRALTAEEHPCVHGHTDTYRMSSGRFLCRTCRSMYDNCRRPPKGPRARTTEPDDPRDIRHPVPIPYGWQAEAACAGQPDPVFFPDKGGADAYGDARQLCQTCPVRRFCLEFAMTYGRSNPYGMYGGLTPDERIALARARRRQDTA